MDVVTISSKVQGGLPCFAGTRVPISSLFDHLRKGYTVDEFLADFPTVSKEQIEGLFLVMMPPETTSSSTTQAPQIQVVLNWFEELKRRMSTQ